MNTLNGRQNRRDSSPASEHSPITGNTSRRSRNALRIKRRLTDRRRVDPLGAATYGSAWWSARGVCVDGPHVKSPSTTRPFQSDDGMTLRLADAEPTKT